MTEFQIETIKDFIHFAVADDYLQYTVLELDDILSEYIRFKEQE